MINRRQFLQTSAGAAALLALRTSRAYAFAQSPGLAKFPAGWLAPGLGAIPFTTGVPDPLFNGAKLVDLVASQYTQQLHPALPKPTTLWGYAEAATGNFKHLGPIIVAQRNVPVRLRMRNNLPPTHIIPVDTTIPGALDAQNRMAIHLHGGLVPWISDGGPFDWFTPSGATGASFMNNVFVPGGEPAGVANYFYPNAQSGRLMWYHDHAFGITRINAYAGLASGYVIRDYGMEGAAGLPMAELGGLEQPLVFQDKIFVPANIALVDPTWKWGAPGDLWYAHTYEHQRWTIGGNGGAGSANNLVIPDPSVIPEFFGDTMLTNGVVYPTMQVQPRRCRFRVLNACNARFLNLNLYVRDATVDGITLSNKGLVMNAAGPAITQIGNEAGFLPNPVTLNAPPLPVNLATMTGSLLLAPAERADILIDFSALPVGTKLILYNDAPAPFPGGKAYNDYYFGNGQNPIVTAAGFGPDTRQIVQFEVVAATAPPDAALNLPALKAEGLLTVPGVLTPPPGVPVRDLTLNEMFDAYGRLIQLLGTTVPGPLGFGRAYTDPATENVKAGTTEVWRIFNTTADTHPIHFHLVNVQVLSRQPFKLNSLGGIPSFTGPARGPEPNELGWKETVRMNPGECTSVIMKFDLPTGVPFPVPMSPRTGGHEYVWHCHILEHEEHDMMRPLIVTP
jgi:spore coat protein A, manganese oxidase